MALGSASQLYIGIAFDLFRYCELTIVRRTFAHAMSCFRLLQVGGIVISAAVQIFSDPLLYQKAFHAADVELLPTARGEFSARMTQIRLNKIWMQRADEGLPRVLLGTVSSTRAIFGFLTDAGQSPTYHCGTQSLIRRSDRQQLRRDASQDRWSQPLGIAIARARRSAVSQQDPLRPRTGCIRACLPGSSEP